jgi:hypothetical protein
MKTKTFFILCLLLGIGLTKLSAQPAIGKSGNWVVDQYFEFTEKVPLNCDYNTIVLLVGPVRSHTVLHYSNFDGNLDNADWFRQDFHGELVLQGTNEVFKVSDIFTCKDPTLTLPGTGHFNVIGNKGSHYIVNYLWDNWADPNDITIISVKCPGDN